MAELYRKTYSIFVLLIALLIASCSDDDGNPPDPFPDINRGDIEANRLKITFTLDTDTTNVQTIEFSDPDGLEGADPIIVDTIKLLGPIVQTAKRNYSSTIEFFDGSDDVTGSIRAKEDEYVICYRDMNTNNLELKRTDVDSDGKRLGFELEWSTVEILTPPPTDGHIKITLNFQPSGKDGLCDPGIRIMEARVPYQIEF